MIFTQDKFWCSICQKELVTVHEYVEHMLLYEKCTLLIEPSTIVKDLLLPRFIKQNYEMIDSTSKPKLEKSLKDKYGEQIETGFGVKWKCKLCSITFSRYAALTNHCKLQHEINTDSGSSKESKLFIKSEANEPTKSNHDSEVISEAPPSIPSSDSTSSLCNINKQDVPICSTCGQIFKSVRILMSHTSIVHSEKRPFVCQMVGCNVAFKTNGSLVRHQRRHTGIRPFICSKCNRKFRESGSLLRHLQSRISCVRKDGKYLSRYGLTLSFTTDNKTDCKLQIQEQLKNEQIGSSIQEMNKTSLGIGGEETKASVRLQICKNLNPVENEGGFKEKELMLNVINMKKELSTSDTKDKLEECGSYEATCTKQEYIDENILRTSFHCPLCEKSYSKESLLSNHLKCHLDGLNNKCPECNKCFTSKFSFSRHLLCHSSLRQFECQLCKKSFKLKSHAQEHLKSHSDDKNIPCIQCGRLFKTVSSRNTHMKIHEGEKKFECMICFKKFLVKSSLERHLRIHSDIKPFECLHCHRKFREQGTLNRHSKSKHPTNDCSRSANPDETFDSSQMVEALEMRSETLSEINDNFSENESELDGYINDKDLSSIYSDPTDTFDPDEFLPINSSFAFI